MLTYKVLRLLAEDVTHIGKVAHIVPRTIAKTKQDGSKVTRKDRMLERFILRLIAAHCPMPVLTEEFFSSRVLPLMGLCAIIDPLDGTSYYLAGSVMWAISIGFLCDLAPIAGILVFPAIGEAYTCFEQKIRVSSWNPASMHLDDPIRWKSFEQRKKAEPIVWNDVGPDAREPEADIRAIAHELSATIKNMPSVYACREIFTTSKEQHAGGDSSTIKSWDIAGSAPFIKACGGVVECWGGGEPPWSLRVLPRVVIANSPQAARKIKSTAR